jgi:hypothetical protein
VILEGKLWAVAPVLLTVIGTISASVQLAPSHSPLITVAVSGVNISIGFAHTPLGTLKSDLKSKSRLTQ